MWDSQFDDNRSISRVLHCLPERSETEVPRSRVPLGTYLASQSRDCLNSGLDGELGSRNPNAFFPSTFYPAKDLIASVARFLAGTGNVEFSKSGPLRDALHPTKNATVVQEYFAVSKYNDTPSSHR